MLSPINFVITMYSRTWQLSNINEARECMFSSGTRQLSRIPPTQAALLQYVKWAVYQGGQTWGNCLNPQPNYHDLQNWGWNMDVSHGWILYWTDFPDAYKACKELIRSGCNLDLGCRHLCKCGKSNLKCTDLCK